MNASNRQVPAYETLEFKPKAHKYCVCVFVINEGEKVQKQLKKMQPLGTLVDFLVADGGSTDGSLNPKFLKEVGVRVVLTKKGPGKLSAQMRMAFSYALQQGYEGVITIDGNDKDDVMAIPLFIEALENNYDHIQGSRFIKGGRQVNTPLARLIGVRAIHAPLLSLASGFHHTDTTNGFRAYSRHLLEDEGIALFRDIFSAYELHYYLSVRSARLGFKLTEVPVTRSYPKGGPTPTKISPLWGNLLVLKTLFRAATNHYNP